MDLFNVIVEAACDPNSPLGCVSPPVNVVGGNAVGQTGSLFGVILRVVIIVGALLSLGYMLWGALDWITSNGEKEKITKAQQKITYAIVGIIAMFLAFGVFGIVAGNMLGIVNISGGAFIFKLPQFGGP